MLRPYLACLCSKIITIRASRSHRIRSDNSMTVLLFTLSTRSYTIWKIRPREVEGMGVATTTPRGCIKHSVIGSQLFGPWSVKQVIATESLLHLKTTLRYTGQGTT